ncbi:hypothetical protein ILUMI_05570 [Ignelater luminosus]|uniref:Uncharacterized protein n=1 Tax=Ignelater luminosus TaxID=2038154 RepID=A0A8K0GDF8_IGNLU|nr:hypothetical protein ILUMI_05570 [Ignelater luminosus]
MEVAEKVRKDVGDTLQTFLPTMVKTNHGHIVAVSSLAGLMGLTRNLSRIHLIKVCSTWYDGSSLHADSKCQINTTCVYPVAAETGLYDIKRAHAKYPKIVLILKSDYVAKCIMDGQRRDRFEVTFIIFRLLPVKAAIAVFEFLDCYFAVDLEII